jgi:hypothetical protein
VGVGVSILQLLSILLTKAVQAKLADATEILLRTLALLIAVENLSPPEFAGGFPRRLIVSIAVVAAFSVLSEFVGLFLGVRHKDRFGAVSMESGWIERVTWFLNHLHNSGGFAIIDDAPQYVHVSDLSPASVDILLYAWSATPVYRTSDSGDESGWN